MNDIIKERNEYVVKSVNPFKDARGAIENYNLIFPVNMANVVMSSQGSVRANHYHPEQLQQVLVVSGSYISVYKDLLREESTPHAHVVKAGDLAITPPMVAHAMIFLEDSVFINLVSGDRDHDKFGQHTIPYQLVSESDKQKYIGYFRNERK